MKRTRLWLYPWGGLCNRMRSLNSAICFARANPCRLDVIWQLKDELHCRIEKLFEPLPVINRILTFDCKTRRGLFLREMYEKWLILPWADTIIKAEEYEKMARDNTSTDSLLKGKATCLQTWVSFYKMGKPFADFKPVPALQNRISEQVRHFSRTVGVHIRRTDHAIAIASSPTTSFFEAMDGELELDPATTFFVSTDSPEEETALRTRYPQKILSYRKKTLNRASTAGIEDAVIDLYCLSKTRKVLGSYRSSFSTTAGAIGGIETVWVQ